MPCVGQHDVISTPSNVEFEEVATPFDDEVAWLCHFKAQKTFTSPGTCLCASCTATGQGTHT